MTSLKKSFWAQKLFELVCLNDIQIKEVVNGNCIGYFVR